MIWSFVDIVKWSVGNLYITYMFSYVYLYMYGIYSYWYSSYSEQLLWIFFCHWYFTLYSTGETTTFVYKIIQVGALTSDHKKMNISYNTVLNKYVFFYKEVMIPHRIIMLQIQNEAKQNHCIFYQIYCIWKFRFIMLLISASDCGDEWI